MKDFLLPLNAPKELREWSLNLTLAEFWSITTRADWMLWIASRMIGTQNWPTHQEVVFASLRCAEVTAAHLLKKLEWDDETYFDESFEAVRRWTQGKASIEEVRKVMVSMVPLAVDRGIELYPGYVAHAIKNPNYACFVIYAEKEEPSVLIETANIVRSLLRPTL